MEENVSHCMNWIRQNEEELIEKYSNKYILVKDEKVRSACDKKQDAMTRGIKRFGRGNFVVYHVVRNDEMNKIDAENDLLLGDLKSFLE